METLTVDAGLQDTMVAALGQCALFRALKPELLPQLLKAADVVRFEPEEVLIRQGDAGRCVLRHRRGRRRHPARSRRRATVESSGG